MATKSMKIGAAVLGGALLVGAAALAGKSMVDSPKAADKTTTTTTTTAPSTATGGLVEFRDDKAGWAISYPQKWNRLQSQDADVALVVSEKPPELNTGGSILARDLALGAPVDEAKLPAAKEVTDKIVLGGEGIQLLAQPTVVHHRHARFFVIFIDGTGERRAVANQMRTAVALADVVGKAQHVFMIRIVPLHGDFGGDAIFFTGKHDSWMQRDFTFIKIFHICRRAAFIIKFHHIFRLDAIIRETNAHAGIEKRQLAQTVFHGVEIEFHLRECFARWQERDARAFFARRIAHYG